MSCFTLVFLRDLLVWLVVMVAVISIIRLLVPWVVRQFGSDIIGQALNIFLWAVVVIMVIYFVFMLIGCLMGGFAHGPFRY